MPRGNNRGNGATLCAWLPTPLAEQFADQARNEELTPSRLIRRLIEEHLTGQAA